MKNKHQHYVPISYLKAWCDPDTPKGNTPYVWRFSLDGVECRKKAPDKIFFETDLYTIRTRNGERDLTIERNLSRLESKLSKIRKTKLDRKIPLSAEETLVVCMFTIAMFVRSKKNGDYWRGMWQEVSAMAERMQQVVEQASPEEKARMASVFYHIPESAKGNTLSMDEVAELAENPLPSNLSAVPHLSPILYRIPHVILQSPKGSSFVTSDAPCVWFDPVEYANPSPFGAGGLISPTIEITLPISPSQMLFFGKQLSLSGAYLHLQDINMVDRLNRRTISWADDYFVFNNGLARPEWFVSSESVTSGEPPVL